MCLTTNNPTIETASHDIKVYKLVRMNSKGFTTLYRAMPVAIGKTYYEPAFADDLPWFSWENRKMLHGEHDRKMLRGKHDVVLGFHSYTRKSDAKAELFAWDKDVVMMECTIPKGTEFIVGTFGSKPSIVSQSIRYDKISLRSPEHV